MASIGMAMQWGTEKFEQDRVRREEAERLMASRQLFDTQMRTATRAAEVEELAQQESKRVEENLIKYKTRIQRGDKQAFVDFMNDTLASEGRSAVLQDDKIVEVDAQGNPVRVIEDLTNMSGKQLVSTAYNYVPTAKEVTQYWQGAVTSDLERVHAVQMEQLKHRNAVGLANLKGSYDLSAANVKAKSDNNIALANLYASQQDKLQNTAYNQALESINPYYTYVSDPITGAPRIMDMQTNEYITLTPEEQTTWRNNTRAILTQAAQSPANQPLLFTGTGFNNQVANDRQAVAAQEAAAASSAAALVGSTPVNVDPNTTVQRPSGKLPVNTPAQAPSSSELNSLLNLYTGGSGYNTYSPADLLQSFGAVQKALSAPASNNPPIMPF